MPKALGITVKLSPWLFMIWAREVSFGWSLKEPEPKE